MTATTNARAKAQQQLAANPMHEVSVWTDATSKPGTLAIGLAFRSGACCLLEVSAKEYTGLSLIEMFDADPRVRRKGH